MSYYHPRTLHPPKTKANPPPTHTLTLYAFPNPHKQHPTTHPHHDSPFSISFPSLSLHNNNIITQ